MAVAMTYFTQVLSPPTHLLSTATSALPFVNIHPPIPSNALTHPPPLRPPTPTYITQHWDTVRFLTFAENEAVLSFIVDR